ncbi:hypothetical protein QZR43_26310, partial [Serratia marcescens]|nr:hypothetical protein [Serratia marcescens]MDP8806501.1 hypothetical protein [Serratia marcescens]
MTLTTERQQFEEWFKLHSDEEECTNLLQRNSASTNYLHPHTDLAWIAWKASREVLANREAQPVEVRRALFTKISNRPADESGNIFYCVAAGEMDLLEAILTAPPAPAVPDDLAGIIKRFQHQCDHLSDWHHIDEHSCKVNRRDLMTVTEFLNACRAAMLAQPVSSGYKFNSQEIPDSWIACSEQMPDDEQECLVQTHSGFRYVSF